MQLADMLSREDRRKLEAARRWEHTRYQREPPPTEQKVVRIVKASPPAVKGEGRGRGWRAERSRTPSSE